MTRPSYESSDSREAEALVANTVGQPRLLVPHRTPRYYPCDWVFQPLEDDPRRLHWLVEVKVRTQAYARYMISLHKVATMVSMARIGGFEPVLVVAWLDLKEVGLCDLGRARLVAGVGGRKDRGDSQDVEPVVYISRSAFLSEPFSQPLLEGLNRLESYHAR